MKMRDLDKILEQCIEETDFEEADLCLKKLNKLLDEALDDYDNREWGES